MRWGSGRASRPSSSGSTGCHTRRSRGQTTRLYRRWLAGILGEPPEDLDMVSYLPGWAQEGVPRPFSSGSPTGSPATDCAGDRRGSAHSASPARLLLRGDGQGAGRNEPGRPDGPTGRHARSSASFCSLRSWCSDTSRHRHAASRSGNRSPRLRGAARRARLHGLQRHHPAWPLPAPPFVRRLPPVPGASQTLGRRALA